MANKLQLKHNKNEDFNIENYTNVILAKSEPLYDTVHKKLYIGDGKTVLSNLTAINVMSDLDAETIINLINNNDQNLKINADRVNISKTVGEETKDYKLSERFDNNGNAIVMLIGLIFLILAPIFGQLMQLAISRKREFLADATAVEFTRNPDGLISALEKISADPNELKVANKATENMYIANPFRNKKKSSDLWSTHPSTEARIEALRNLK